MKRLLALETRYLLGQAVTWAVLVPLTLALIVAAWAGASRIAGQHDMIARAQAEERRIEDAARAAASRFATPAPFKVDLYRDPTGPYSYMTMFLVRSPVQAPSPLGALAIGQSDIAPTRVRMTFGFSAMFTDEFADIGSPRMLKRGGFDIAFVLVYLLPLAIIALAATRLSGEQQSGLLRMIAAQPVRIRTVAAAKFGAVALLFLGWLPIAGTAALAAGGMLPVAPGWGGTLAWLAVALAGYILFWVGVCALAVSLWRGPAVAIACAMAAWALLAILLPSALALGLNLRAPPPSRIGYIDISRRAMAHYYEAGDHLARAWAQRQPGLRDRADLAVTTEIKRLARDAYFARTLAAPRRALDVHRRDVAHDADRLALLSPPLAIQRALERAAGSDALRQVRFQRAVDGFDRHVRGHFRPLILADVLNPVRPCPACPARLSFSGWSAVPRFPGFAGFSAPTTAAWQACLLLAALVAGSLLLARWRFREALLPV